MDQDIRFREYCSSEELEKKKNLPDPIKNELGEISAEDDESVLVYTPTKVIRPIKKNIQHYYYMTQKGLFFNTNMFIYEIVGGVFHGTVITVATIAAYDQFIVDKDGRNSDFWCVSIVIYTVLIIVTNLMTIIRGSHITWLLLVAVFLTSLTPFILWMVFYDRWTALNTLSNYSVWFILGNWHYYQAVLLNTFFVCFYEICRFFLKYYINPTMTEYTLQLRKKKLIQDEQFWQEDLIEIVKKNSSKFRANKKVRNDNDTLKQTNPQDDMHSTKLVRTITHI